MKMNHRHHCPTWRRAAVAVEFAFVAPVLIFIALGIIELTRTYDAQNLLDSACREGARFASMDREGMLQEGQTTNSKLVQDVKHFLAANGLPADLIDVYVRDAEDPSSDFDLDAPENDLRLFKVEIELPYSAVTYTPGSGSDDYMLKGSITFRNGRATLSQ